MIVRKIKPDEVKRTDVLFAIAFECEMDNTNTEEKDYEETTSDPKSRDDKYLGERWAAYQDDNQTMMSYFVAKPYPILFDQQHCTMIGIGGVSTLPQYRRMGGIRGCFEAALPAMYENGVAFSYLYPFSTAYYRKFGYEMCCERLRYQIKLSAIRPFSVAGNCFLVDQEHLMLEDIKQVYEVWQNKYNLMVENEDFEYAWVLSSNPAKDQRFTYVYKSESGVPKGFMTFFKENDTNERNLKCSRFFFTDIEGFQGLMNLLYTCASDHLYVIFELPTDQVITPLIPEWSMGAGKCEKLFCGMVRVVDVAQVLRMAKYRGDGTLVIQIDDAFIPQNNKSFCVNFRDNAARSVDITDAPADISLGIGDFSRLIVGVCDISALDLMESVHIRASIEKISKVFYQKPNLLTEYF